MRHLVLGGGGFIGSHLVRRLTLEGHEVCAVDVSFPDYRAPLWQDAQLLNTDLRDPEAAEDAIRWSWGPDTVWQLAADMGGVEYFHSSRDWGAAVNNNQINVNVMQVVAAMETPPKVVFTSTACALATEEQTHYCRDEGYYWPLTEEDIEWGTPDQLYGQEKRHSAFMWSRAPLDTRVCFLHTVYGPYQEYSGIRMKMPMALAQKARRARETGVIEVLGDGRQVRTLLYVDDAIDRLLALEAAPEDPGMVNIGSTQPYTVDEVVDVAARAAGLYENGLPDYRVRHVPGPTGVEARGCDMRKFEAAFPEFSSKDDVPVGAGFLEMVEWLDEVDPL